MKFLFIAGGGSATVFAVAPLAHAARGAGHQVIVAVPQDSVHVVTNLGLPAVKVCDLAVKDAMLKDRNGTPLERPRTEDKELEFAGRGFARLTAASLPALYDLADGWRPDIVVGGAHTHAAPLIARRLGIPFVRQAWDLHERSEADWQGATDELQPELNELGLDEIPESDLFVDFTPPLLQPEDPEPAELMQFIAGNTQAELEPWMYVKGDLPRILITAGSRGMIIPALGLEFFDRLLGEPIFDGTKAEVVIATDGPIAEQLREKYPHVKAGWIPLDVVGPTADVAVHQGGGVTASTLLAAGTPQVVLPEMLASAIPLRRIDAVGASITLDSHTVPGSEVAAAVEKVLSDPSYKLHARDAAAQVRTLKSPSEVIGVMERLARERALESQLA